MREVVCTYCNHKQKTKSKLNMITCSSCQKKFPTNNNDDLNSVPEKDVQNNILEEKEDRKVSLGY